MKERIKAEYRSSVRSKELIKTAYFETLKKKPAEKITVTDIVTAAKINRGTFYAHYDNTADLSRKIEEEFCCELYEALKKLSGFENKTSLLETLDEISRFLEKNEEQYKVIATIGRADKLIFTLQNLFIEYMENNADISENIRKSPRFAVRTRFFAAGVANVYISYFKGELDVSLTSLSEILNEMIINNSLIF